MSFGIIMSTLKKMLIDFFTDPTAFKAFIKLFGVVAVTIEGMWLSMLWELAKVVLKVGAFIFTPLAAAMTVAGENIKFAWQIVVQSITLLALASIKKLMNLFNSMALVLQIDTSGIENFEEAVKDTVLDVPRSFETVMTELGGMSKDMLGTVGGNFKKMAELASDEFAIIKNAVKDLGPSSGIDEMLAKIEEIKNATAAWAAEEENLKNKRIGGGKKSLSAFQKFAIGVKGGLNELEKANNNYVERGKQAFSSFYSSLTSGFSSTFDEMLDGTMSFSEGFTAIMGTVKDSFFKVISDMAAQWLATQTVMLLKHIFVEKAKSAVTAKEEASRLLIQAGAAVKSIAITVATAIKEIAVYAAKAAAAAFAAIAGIPFVGPFLAVAAAAAAFAAVMRFAGSFEKGTGPEGIKEDGVAMVHKGEVILNKQESDAYRSGYNRNNNSNTNSSRTPQTVNRVDFTFNIKAFDGDDVERTVSKKILPMLKDNIRDFGELREAIEEI